jgi:hypothetical protein
VGREIGNSTELGVELPWFGGHLTKPDNGWYIHLGRVTGGCSGPGYQALTHCQRYGSPSSFRLFSSRASRPAFSLPVTLSPIARLKSVDPCLA